jgi:Zn finger protein HypA/HybF involved in hydrogenase expression
MVEREQPRPERREELAESGTSPLPRLAVTPAAQLRCPYCHGELAKDLLAARCEVCRTAHHATCFAERGACSVHGCRGRAAHIGSASARAGRQAFGPCRACQATIFLDERAALCRKCDSMHHPGCIESRGSCARCGATDATLMAASEFALATREVRRVHARSSFPAVATGACLVVAALVAFLRGNVDIGILLAVCAFAEFMLGLAVYLRGANVARLVLPQPVAPIEDGRRPGEG